MNSFEILALPEAVADRVRRLRSDDHGNTEIDATVADRKRACWLFRLSDKEGVR
jgi:hypothetical protein